MRIRLPGLALLFAVVTALAPNAIAQTPDGALEESFVDKAQRWAADTQILERLAGTIDGWYPRLGGITRGSGLAGGVGYRRHLFGDAAEDAGVLLDLSVAGSIKKYTAIDAKVRWLHAFDGRFELWTDYRRADFPEEDFFGPGPDSALDARTSYALRSSDIALRGEFRPTAWSRLGATFGYRRPRIGPGHDDQYPSIEALFTDVAAPGLEAQPNYLHTTVAAEIDYRDAPGNPRRGGFYRASYSVWDDRSFDAFDFRRTDLVAAQYVPLTPSRRHVVSGRIGVSTTNNAPGQRVPFYALPYVGGSDTIRSFHEFRFRDENAMSMSLEYRFIPITWVSVAAFVDAGTVAHDWQDLTPTNLKPGYGFGIRAHTAKQRLAAIDIGFGGHEGMRVFMHFGGF